MTREINDAGLGIIERDEGCELTAYYDSAGIATIGYGHTPAVIGQTITQDEAVALLKQDVTHACRVVETATNGIATSDDQFSAMASLTFNIGERAFRGSSLLLYHRAGAISAAGEAFLKWDRAHVNGELVVLPGLLRRRQEERSLYLGLMIPPKPAQRILYVGMSGDDVTILQTRLTVLGYPCGRLDGEFGDVTEAAVAKFQAANGLDPDGIVGAATREKLGP